MVDSSIQNERMLDMKEFMSLMHCKRSSVYRWRRQGKIASVVVGRKILFRAKEVETFLEANTKRICEKGREALLCP
ncbi:MAG TPA: helix-turn-helix domain-containing protein [Thermotogota bacterium]|nr:helix-turn-helix domain-containing protein [Thermotogota bacterium]